MSRFFSTTLVSASEFVPKCVPVKGADLLALHKFIREAKHLLVLTGAGLSTESGIPDYRSAGVGLYAKTSRRPVQFQDFIKHESSRRRYWARNFMAWPQFSSFEPNISHKVLANWEKTNKIHHLITQNVDRLHTKAGSQRVVELHGTTHQVICLDCGHLQSRFDLQNEIMFLNQEWMSKINGTSAIAPDGDVYLSDDVVSDFQIPSCNKCGGIVKPDVVFFGENVPRKTAQMAEKFIEECDSLFVVGSSLFVYSGYKLVVKCKEGRKKVAILNIGQTRADNLADLKIEAKCGEVLSKL